MTPSPRRPEHLQRRLVEFGIAVCRSLRTLRRDPVTDTASQQLIRSVISSAANYGEARSAESRRDFIHKMQICLKELRETDVLLQFVSALADKDWSPLLAECNELTAIFVSSLKTANRNRGHDQGS